MLAKMLASGNELKGARWCAFFIDYNCPFICIKNQELPNIWQPNHTK
jgi:hypothetical protein